MSRPTPVLFVAALLAASLLAACGAPAAQVAPGAQPGATTRTIVHAMGTTAVPASPQRVVVLDTGELDSVLALGVTPVGAVTAFADGTFQAYLSAQTGGIQTVGTIAEPNLEQIVALKPDLILSSKTRHKELYGQLAQIAPTVFAERVGVVWKDNFKLHAEALGKTAEAAQIEAAYAARIQTLRAALGEPAQTSVSVVRFLDGQVRQYQAGSFIGTILSDIGVGRPAQQQQAAETWTEVNRELIPELDADAMFVTSYGPADRTPKAAFQADPLWSRLAVVRDGRVYEVADDHWMLGLGYLAAGRVLDDLSSRLAAQQ